MGLVFIGFNYCLMPLMQQLAGITIAPFELPTEFWYGWSGIVATWTLGRTAEKIGIKNKATQTITGSGSLLR